MIFAILRIGTQIALPGIDSASVVAAREAMGVGNIVSMISGGANSSWSIFAMGIGPYINASIIMQLLTIAIPKFEQLSKEGPEGRKKLQSYKQIFDSSACIDTRYWVNICISEYVCRKQYGVLCNICVDTGVWFPHLLCGWQNRLQQKVLVMVLLWLFLLTLFPVCLWQRQVCII